MTFDEPKKVFPVRLKKLRKEKDMTQKELGKVLNFYRTTISNYESGRNEPSNEVLQKLSDFFGVTIDYMLGRTDNRNTVLVEKDDLPQSVKELGVEYFTVNQYAKEKGISPENLRKIITAIEALEKD